MIEGYSLRKSAVLIGNITHVTLFYWRHKLLSSLKQMEIPNFEGIVEIDETYFLYSEKGQRKIKGRKPRKRGGSAKKRGISNEQVCVLAARDRDKTTVSQILGMGRLTKDQLKNAIVHLKHMLLKREWIFINSSPMVKFVQRSLPYPERK